MMARASAGVRDIVAFGTLLIFFLALVVRPARAAEPNWDAVGADYVVVSQDLRDVLAEISNHLGLSSFISEEIKGKVTQSLQRSSLRDVMETLKSRYGVVWYYDGGKVYYSLLKENISQIVSIGSAQFLTVRKQLADLGVVDARFELKYSEAGHTVFVSGPPRYVELVRQGIDAANARVAIREQAKSAVVIYGRKTTGP